MHKDNKQIRISLIGYGFMGKAHAYALRALPSPEKSVIFLQRYCVISTYPFRNAVYAGEEVLL